MCGPPCQDCSGHVYSHGLGKYHGVCLNCYVKRFPTTKNECKQDDNGNWVWKGNYKKSDAA